MTDFGQRVFPVGGSTAGGIGALYGARGIGDRSPLSALFFIPGGLWLLILSRWKKTPPVGHPSDHASGEEEVLESRIG